MKNHAVWFHIKTAFTCQFLFNFTKKCIFLVANTWRLRKSVKNFWSKIHEPLKMGTCIFQWLYQKKMTLIPLIHSFFRITPFIWAHKMCHTFKNVILKAIATRCKERSHWPNLDVILDFFQRYNGKLKLPYILNHLLDIYK